MAGAIDFSKIPPEQLAQIPAGIPPPGVVPNLINPPNAGNYIIIANSILMAIMIIFVALRFYVVFKIKRRIGADDWAVVFALIGSCYYFVVVCLGKAQHLGRASDDATDEGSSCQRSQVRYTPVRPLRSSYEDEKRCSGRSVMLLSDRV
jgi:hypothetical protein